MLKVFFKKKRVNISCFFLVKHLSNSNSPLKKCSRWLPSPSSSSVCSLQLGPGCTPPPLPPATLNWTFRPRPVSFDRWHMGSSRTWIRTQVSLIFLGENCINRLILWTRTCSSIRSTFFLFLKTNVSSN